MEYNKGDRVKVSGEDTAYFKKGDKGTIVGESGGHLLIELDKEIGLDCGWFIDRDDLEAIV